MTEWTRIRQERTLFEDEAVLALDKPVGVSVVGERHDTDLVSMAKEAGEELFPAHRIDKVTSGVVLFAKQLRVHGDLTRQFNRRTVEKTYLALTRTRGLPAAATIDLPLSVGRKNRVRIAANRADIVAVPAASGDAGDAGDAGAALWTVPAAKTFPHVRTYPSVTRLTRVWEGKEHTLIAAHPVSGRRHQIRVHLAWVGHPIEGDPLFERAPTTRTFLHAWRLDFDAPGEGGARMHAEAAPGPDFWLALEGGEAAAAAAALAAFTTPAEA
ncbi:tRNA pseudouridine32 synthase / 23S rRNA pseudouridine746 synthase [Frankia sp. EI5c]|uniref:RluA family pseudouridine synthase n=1 Tax=Frankia sp. EI5c TaxID=683316 RepID=UPI0007C243C5|nr:RNA pseudouridine synthase [Frankia sp. EI5c]OAA26182.1 tRNA pseudouridine32 synthase / 23S rRNA pseudouridine746 synthase [Frankia sp. EI5c]